MFGVPLWNWCQFILQTTFLFYSLWLHVSESINVFLHIFIYMTVDLTFYLTILAEYFNLFLVVNNQSPNLINLLFLFVLICHYKMPITMFCLTPSFSKLRNPYVNTTSKFILSKKYKYLMSIKTNIKWQIS